jgi:uncharacterized protein YjbI with pentapeptide repeats
MSIDAASPPGNLETARKSIEDTAAVGAGLWLSYLFVLFYLAVAAGAVTHADLLLQQPVKLPFLNIELPLLAFFFLAPLLFLLTHAYTLVHLKLLADRVAQFNEELRASPEEDPALWRRRLPSNIFVQFLGASEQDRYGPFGLLLAMIFWVTLVIAPIALFFLLQLQFLPYHSRWITWTSRIALALDLGLLWWLWRDILRSRTRRAGARPWRRVLKTAAGAVLTPAIILFSYEVATFPGEWQETYAPGGSAFGLLRAMLFEGDVNPFPVPGRRTSPFSNTIVLPFFNIYDALKIDDPKKAEWKEYLIDLRKRDLNGAVLYSVVLPKSRLDGAQLEEAALTHIQLQGSSLSWAQLQGATLESAQLQGASLDGAQLRGASLSFAQLQGASLWYAKLQGARLVFADLRGTVLNYANLQGVSLEYAQLQGASLDHAELQGASLDHAGLQGTLLDAAQFQGASFDGAQLHGASLEGAFVWRARLDWDPAQSKDLFAPSSSLDWSPEYRGPSGEQDWTDSTYADLRELMEHAIGQVDRRKEALGRVAILDCAQKGEALASCDRKGEPPTTVKQWKTMIEAASVDQTAYFKTLAKILGDLACSSELAVLNGLLKPAIPTYFPEGADLTPALAGTSRFAATRSEAPALEKRIMSSKCPVSTMLSDADKRAIRRAVVLATSH